MSTRYRTAIVNKLDDSATGHPSETRLESPVETTVKKIGLSESKFKNDGAPGGIRTPNPQIRSLMLCPVELRAPYVWFKSFKLFE